MSRAYVACQAVHAFILPDSMPGLVPCHFSQAAALLNSPCLHSLICGPAYLLASLLLSMSVPIIDSGASLDSTLSSTAALETELTSSGGYVTRVSHAALTTCVAAEKHLAPPARAAGGPPLHWPFCLPSRQHQPHSAPGDTLPALSSAACSPAASGCPAVSCNSTVKQV